MGVKFQSGMESFIEDFGYIELNVIKLSNVVIFLMYFFKDNNYSIRI